MNNDRWLGNWMQVKGNTRVLWGRLTHDHLNLMAGRRDCLAGKIQERRGICSDEAKKQPVDWPIEMPDLASTSKVASKYRDEAILKWLVG